MKYRYLLSAYCHSEIFEIKKEGYHLLTNKNIGEYNFKYSWMSDNLIVVYNKNKKIEKWVNSDKEKWKKNYVCIYLRNKK